MAVNEERIKEIVREVLSSRFEGVQIVSVSTRADVDEDGDDIIAIDIVFDGKEKRLDSRQTSTIARRVIPKMREIGEGAFPIFSFIAQSEIGKLRPETR